MQGFGLKHEDLVSLSHVARFCTVALECEILSADHGKYVKAFRGDRGKLLLHDTNWPKNELSGYTLD